MFFFTDIILIAIVAAVVGAGIVLAIVLPKKKNSEKPDVDKNLLVDGIKNNALTFSEMYEPVYAVSEGKNFKQAEIFAAWNNAVADCNDEELQKAFNAQFGGYAAWGIDKKGKVNSKKLNKIYAKKATALVKTFFKAGIIREDEAIVVANETTAEKYIIVDGAVENGNTYDVLAPYWHLGNDVVDKGVIR